MCLPLFAYFIVFFMYFAGLVSVVWFVCWCYFVSESPAEHPTISKAEVTYIQSSIGYTNQQTQVSAVKKRKIPKLNQPLALSKRH